MVPWPERYSNHKGKRFSSGISDVYVFFKWWIDWRGNAHGLTLLNIKERLRYPFFSLCRILIFFQKITVLSDLSRKKRKLDCNRLTFWQSLASIDKRRGGKKPFYYKVLQADWMSSEHIYNHFILFYVSLLTVFLSFRSLFLTALRFRVQ